MHATMPAERIRALTPRQVEAIAWTWHGYTIAQLAAAMGCSYETARNHLHNGYIRLGIDRDGDDPAGCPRVLAAVALYRALEQSTKGQATMAKIPPQFVKKPAGGKAPAGKPASGGTKVCPKCKAKMPASATKCPDCGMPMKGK